MYSLTLISQAGGVFDRNSSCHFASAQLLVQLVSSYRYDGEHVDEEIAKFEAAELHDAIRKSQPCHAEVIRILSTRNKVQLEETFKHYEQNFGKAIDEVLRAMRKGITKYTKLYFSFLTI